MMHLVQEAQFGGLHRPGAASYINGNGNGHVNTNGNNGVPHLPFSSSTRTVRLQQPAHEGKDVHAGTVSEVAFLLTWILLVTRQQSEEQNGKGSQYIWGYHTPNGEDELLPLPTGDALGEILNVGTVPQRTISEALDILNDALGRNSSDTSSRLGSSNILFFSDATKTNNVMTKDSNNDEVCEFFNHTQQQIELTNILSHHSASRSAW